MDILKDLRESLLEQLSKSKHGVRRHHPEQRLAMVAKWILLLGSVKKGEGIIRLNQSPGSVLPRDCLAKAGFNTLVMSARQIL